MKMLCWHLATASVFFTLLFPVVSQAKSSVTFCYRAANQFPSLAAALYQCWNQRWNQCLGAS